MNKNPTKKTWVILFLLSFLGIGIWYALSYPQFAFLNLSVDKSKANQISSEFLKSFEKIDPKAYVQTTVFVTDGEADRYLQRSLGFEKENEFLKEHDFGLFVWVVRFFKENQKEEYLVTVSAMTGEVTAFKHIIDESAARSILPIEEAKTIAATFLGQRFKINFEDYNFHSEHTRKLDNRVDHSFAWEKKGVYIPWSKEPDSGGAKILMGATISGESVLTFSKERLDIPDQFSRYIQKLMGMGNNLSTVFMLFYILLISVTIFFVILRRNHLAMHVVKKGAIALAVAILIFNLLAAFNQFEYTLFSYNTAISMESYLFKFFMNLLIAAFLSIVVILTPTLAGESLQREVFPLKPRGSFLHYLSSTFFSRNVFELIILGYLVAVFMLASQSMLFAFGQKYFGVWVDYNWIAEFSSSYIPFLTAFIIGFNASFVEEITFRIFAISWLTKVTKSVIFAAIISSVFWGFGHSHYQIFPMWFRGIEVSIIGLLLSFFYLRYGIIPVIVAHYVFDAFWHTTAFLLGKTTLLYFSSAVFVLALPLLFGIIAYLKNRPESEGPLRWQLNKHQLFNLDVLNAFLKLNTDRFKNMPTEKLRNELVAHNWDLAVIDAALENFRK